MPRCWMANVISISTAPMKNAALNENATGPSVPWKRDQSRIAGVNAATASVERRAATASAAVLPWFATSHSAMRGESSGIEVAWALTQAATCGASAGGMAAREFRIYAAAIEHP